MVLRGFDEDNSIIDPPSSSWTMTTTANLFDGRVTSASWSSALKPLPVPLQEVVTKSFVSRGAYDETYKGVFRGRIVAIKMSRVELQQSSHAMQMFVDEVIITATLDHPRILKLLGVAWSAASLADLYMVSEFVAGGNLCELLERNESLHRELGFDYDSASCRRRFSVSALVARPCDSSRRQVEERAADTAARRETELLRGFA